MRVPASKIDIDITFLGNVFQYFCKTDNANHPFRGDCVAIKCVYLASKLSNNSFESRVFPEAGTPSNRIITGIPNSCVCLVSSAVFSANFFDFISH